MVERSRPKALVIDDDERAAARLSELLAEKFDVQVAPERARAEELAVKQGAEAVLIDLGSSGEQVFETCRRLRAGAATAELVVVLTSDRDDESLRVAAFEAQADDFVVLPISARELHARLSSRLARVRGGTAGAGMVNCGNLTIDVGRLEARVGQQRVPLSILELALLRYFIDHRNRVLTRDQIISAVWHDPNVTERTVDTHVAQLRKKLSDFDGRIQTIYGSGYVLKTLG